MRSEGLGGYLLSRFLLVSLVLARIGRILPGSFLFLLRVEIPGFRVRRPIPGYSGKPDGLPEWFELHNLWRNMSHVVHQTD